MKIRPIYFLSILVIVLSSACSKCDISKDTPDCVRSKIRQFDTETDCDKGVKVSKYIYQGEAVYVFDPGLCGADMTSEVVNEHCTTLGYLGGISGNTTINNENFSNAVFQNDVWEKN